MSHPCPPEETACIRSQVLSAAARPYLEKGFSKTTVKDLSASGITAALSMIVMKSRETIQFVSQFDYPKLAQSTIRTMLADLEREMNPDSTAAPTR